MDTICAIPKGFPPFLPTQSSCPYKPPLPREGWRLGRRERGYKNGPRQTSLPLSGYQAPQAHNKVLKRSSKAVTLKTETEDKRMNNWMEMICAETVRDARALIELQGKIYILT